MAAVISNGLAEKTRADDDLVHGLRPIIHTGP
jgi:hypothetical protein